MRSLYEMNSKSRTAVEKLLRIEVENLTIDDAWSSLIMTINYL